mmetsp:Transcript_52048/g.108704  ORF Transcript_52048/g.108704 Transcript_52048/m.108704 type:complete len:242 (-) Transcript_52048:1056-1781(-)
MNPLRALQHGLGMKLYGDVTHKVSHHLVNVAQMAVNNVSGRGHLWGLMIHPHGTESGDFYKEMYLVLLGGMLNLMEHTKECEAEACELCLNLKKMREERSIVDFLSLDRSPCSQGMDPLPVFPWTSTRSDFNPGWQDLTTSVIGLDRANTCATHLGIIGYRNGTHAKYIESREFREDNDEGFRPMIRKIADLTNIQHVVIAQRKFVQHLESINEFRAAAWIRDTWLESGGGTLEHTLLCIP